MTGLEKYPLEDVVKRWHEETPLFSVDHAMGQSLLYLLSMEQQMKELIVEIAALRARVQRLEKGGEGDVNL